MKSIDVKFIIPDELEIDDLAKIFDDIDAYDFFKKDGSIFKVKLKHSLMRDKLFIIEEDHDTLD